MTAKRIKKCFTWKGLATHCKRCIRNCLQCIKLTGGLTMPRPMGHQLLAEKPFEVIIIDFLKMSKSRDDRWEWVLVIVDQLTRMTVLVPCGNCVAIEAAPAVVER